MGRGETRLQVGAFEMPFRGGNELVDLDVVPVGPELCQNCMERVMDRLARHWLSGVSTGHKTVARELHTHINKISCET
jgi:hypothetical protein